MLVPIAQLDGFARPGGGARRYGSPSKVPSLERDISLHCRVSPRVENLAAF